MNQTKKYLYCESETPLFMENNNRQEPTCWATYLFIPLVVAAVIAAVCITLNATDCCHIM